MACSVKSSLSAWANCAQPLMSGHLQQWSVDPFQPRPWES